MNDQEIAVRTDPGSITLHQYFCGQAIAGLSTTWLDTKEIVKRAVNIADMMIEELAERQSTDLKDVYQKG